MLRLAANLSTMFADAPLEARFAHAAAAGFQAVEMQFPYAIAPLRLVELLSDNGLELVLFNAPAGDIAAGERGLVLEGGSRFDAAITTALDYMEATGCRLVHVMVGNGPAGHQADLVRAAATIAGAAQRFAPFGAQLLLEALNPKDQPDYCLPSLAAAETLRLLAGEPNIRLQFDAYHAARSGGDPVALLAAHAGHTAHIQLADAADRGEPDSPQMQAFLAAVEGMDWPGFVGCEYRPRGDTVSGLGWAIPHGLRVPGNAEKADRV